MVGQVVLVRHGIAEKRSVVSDDQERQLTPKGADKIKRIAPGLKKLLDPQLEWQIMASPLARAAQTGVLLGKKLQLPVRFVAALATGEWPVLARQLSKLSARQGVVLVGHEPFLSEWSGLLTGSALPFKKGAAACCRFDEAQVVAKAELRWFVQPAELIRLGEKGDSS